MSQTRSIFLYIFAIFFILAGVNHFRVPETYLSIIPPYLPMPSFLNYLTGAAEIAGGMLLLIPKTRRPGAMLIITLLVLFLPAHLYMIQIAPFHLGETLVTPFIAWLRLPVQGLLIWWGYQYRKE